MNSDDEQRLRQLARQVQRPQGADGLRVAASMHTNNLRMTHSCFDALSLGADETLLEIGHGGGAHIPAFFAAQPSPRYQGLEISELMVKEATKANQDRVEKGTARFTAYEGRTFPFAAGEFDAAMAVNTLYFLPDPAAFLAEIRRTLRAGGRLGIAFAPRSFMQHLSFAQYGFRLYEADEVQVMLAEAGFTEIHAGSYQELVTSKERPDETLQRDFVVVRARRGKDWPDLRSLGDGPTYAIQ